MNEQDVPQKLTTSSLKTTSEQNGLGLSSGTRSDKKAKDVMSEGQKKVEPKAPKASKPKLLSTNFGMH